MRFKAIIFDMDGVLYRGHEPIRGVGKAISALREKGTRIFFLTNNSSKSRAQICRSLKAVGIEAHKSEVDGSSYAAAKFISSRSPHARVLPFGEKGLRYELAGAGLRLVDSNGSPQYVVTGLNRQGTYAKLKDAFFALQKGAFWVACNMDRTYPRQRGQLWPGAGLFIAALSNATMRKPDVVVGKPNLQIIRPILQGLSKQGIRKSEIALVGDRLDTDVLLANRAGITSILVLSGVATKTDAKKAKGMLKPKFVLNSAADLPKFLKS